MLDVILRFLTLGLLRVCPRCRRWERSAAYRYVSECGQQVRDPFCSHCQVRGVPRLRGH